MKNIYVFAKLGNFDCLGIRIGGAGLGNILFPWSRAIIASKKNNIPMINSTWKALKIGPLLRGEMDTRGYSDLFITQHIKNFKKLLLLTFAKRIDEENFETALSKNYIWPRVIVFTGMKLQAKNIVDDYKLVKHELISMTDPKHLRAIVPFSGRGITLHIRLGDFYQPSSEDEIRSGKTNCRLPLIWYITMIKKFREIHGDQLAVNVFSDGSDDELQEILSLPNVNRHYFGSAIADILAIAKSEIFIASNSTFSLWASYLGRMPTIWFPGTLKFQLHPNQNDKEIEIDYDSTIPESFQNILKDCV